MKTKLLTSATMPASYDGAKVSGVWIDEAPTFESLPGFPIYLGEIDEDAIKRETSTPDHALNDPAAPDCKSANG